MKIALIHPRGDGILGKVTAYPDEEQALPTTGIAMLSSYLGAKTPWHEVVMLNPNRTDEEIAAQSARADMLGVSMWYYNHARAVDIARLAKQMNPQLKIVLGGYDASAMPELLLRKYPFVDHVVVWDGEDALLALAEGAPLGMVPNLWYRHGRETRFTFRAYVKLGDSYPLWDFRQCQDEKLVLAPYLNTVTKIRAGESTAWDTNHLSFCCSRGCPKASREGKCTYCTASEEKMRCLSPRAYWEQLRHLDQLYGRGAYYIGDDVFTLSPGWIRKLAEAKPSDLEAPFVRACGYMNDLVKLGGGELDRMAVNLRTLGVFNLFFGLEGFDSEKMALVNKWVPDIREVERVITQLDRGGIKSTIACIIGFPGETRENLDLYVRRMDKLLELDGVERAAVAILLPLRGSKIFEDLCRDERVVDAYQRATGKYLLDDDLPDQGILEHLHMEIVAGIDPELVNEGLDRILSTARKHLPPSMVGGMQQDRI